MTQRTARIWDLPTRIFRWALAACIVGLVITANVGGNAMVWHFRLGYTVLALLVFRLVWGLVEGRWSRFSAFLYSPARLVQYLRGAPHPEDSIGHSPLGALSVFVLLAVLAAQVGTGLLSDDEIAFAGPLTQYVSNAVVGLATNYHRTSGSSWCWGWGRCTCWPSSFMCACANSSSSAPCWTATRRCPRRQHRRGMTPSAASQP